MSIKLSKKKSSPIFIISEEAPKIENEEPKEEEPKEEEPKEEEPKEEEPKEEDEEEKEEEEETEEQIDLQLGDIILIKDPTNEILNNHTFFIQYIDSEKIKLIDDSDLNKIQLKITADGVLNDGTITEIDLLYRNKYPGYATQNHLLPGQWITIYFGGDIPTLVTGEITNLEEDMIEINKYPEKELFYINFDYKGIPENIPIERIQLRDPITLSQEGLNNEGVEGEEEVDEADIVKVGEELSLDDALPQASPVKQIRETLKQNIIEADQIEFGNYMAPVQEFINVGKDNYRFNLEAQTNDLLNDILSTIPPNKRTNIVLNNIHIMITRFIQLRAIGSNFDKNKNIVSIVSKTANDKPLTEYLSKFKNKLYWLLLVAKNKKKVYDVVELKDREVNVDSDITAYETEEMLRMIQELVNQYRSNDSTPAQNKYTELYSSLNPIMTPFISIPPEKSNEIICEHAVSEDMNIVIDNLGDVYSSTVSKDTVVARRFAFQKYNTGLSRLEATNVKGSKMIADRVPLTPNDLISIRSVLTLPEPTVRFSQINLPGSSILTKSNLQLNFLNYWQLLKKHTLVNKVEITDLDNQLDYDEDSFVDNIKHYILELEERGDLSDMERYEAFLNVIIPKIKVLFDLTKKYIHGKLSLINLIGYLEPFLVYSNDLTYMQYIEMNKFIREKIIEYNKSFIEDGREFAGLKTLRNPKKGPTKYVDMRAQGGGPDEDRISVTGPNSLILLEILNKNQQNKQIVIEKYDINDVTYMNNSEFLKKTTMIDFGNLYNTAVAFENITLMFPTELNAILDVEKDALKGTIDQEEENNTCKNYVIAKKYNSKEELVSDNGNPVYFDKKYDNTPYYLLDDFVNEKTRLDPTEFILFLSDRLQKKQKYSAYDAEYTAESLVAGFKKVIDGQYAIIFNEDYKHDDPISPEAVYYVRKNNEWIEDKNLDAKNFVDQSDTLCLVQPTCLTQDTKCDSLSLSKNTLVSNALTEILDQFDKNYKISKEDLTKKLTSYLEKYTEIFDKILHIEKHRFYQYNNQQYELGLLQPEDNLAYIHSPYESLRDIILGQADFVKKQTDIIKFVSNFARPAIEGNANINDGELETVFWLYCKKTNAKLLPTFVYSLAAGFIQNNNNYNEIMNNIIKVQGKLSDDGDSWVDKYSGYPIKPIDWDVEEGYEEGFRITTRDVLEEDAGQNVTIIAAKKILNPQSIMIQNVVQSLTSFMGFSLDNQNEFILSTVNTLINDTNVLVKKQTYAKHADEMVKKGKKIPEYEVIYYSTLLYLTLGCTLIAIQTSIPSIRTKKTFPGCIRSFAGFPIEGEGNYAGLTYLACVVHKIKSSTPPWSILSKVSDEKIAESIKQFTVKYLLPNMDVTQKIKDKVNYLLTYPEDNIPEVHSIQLWSNFLPPLKKLKLKNIQNISDGFITTLMREIHTGSTAQNERLLVIQSKIIHFSFAIQECIQKIIDKKALLLNNSVHPYMDNACCNESDKRNFTVLQYFIAENFEIANYNLIVDNLSIFMRDIQLLTEASMFLSSIDTKRYYPPVDTHFNEDTIYTAFISYCRLNSYMPTPQDLLPLCKNKPEFMNINETMSEIIYKLKRDGHQYSEDSLLRLLQLVSRNNIIPSTISIQDYATIHRLRDLFVLFDKTNDDIIAPTLRNLMESLLDTYDTSVTSDTADMRKLKNYLDTTNNSMKTQLLTFIKQKGDIDSGKYKKLENFIRNISEWSFNTERNSNTISDNGMYNYIQFFKTQITMFSKVYPNMILNKQIHTLRIPKYWGLSSRHEGIIAKEVSDFYSSIKKFYGNNTIVTLLNKIQEKCRNIVLLSKETPALTEIKTGSNTTYSVFDKRISSLLFEYYLLQVLTSYMELTNDPNMLYRAPPSEDQEIELDGNVNTLKKTVANLLIVYINIMEDTKSTIDISHGAIIDKVFKLREREKDTFTDRLQAMTDEQRNVDTILKINKLGVWNKGLTKGLKEYDPENFDQERDIMTKISEIEKQVRRNPEVNDQNIDFFVDDFIEDMNNQEDADNEDYDMSNLNDDYINGDFEGEEEENPQDYD